AELHFGRRERWASVTDVSQFAGFAPEVIRAAGQGDLACREILGAAARSRADGLCAVLNPPGVEPVAATTGRLLGNAPAFRSMVLQRLLEKRDDVRVQPTAGSPLDGSLHLALMLATLPAVVQEHVPLLAIRIGTAPRGDDSITMAKVVVPAVRPLPAQEAPPGARGLAARAAPRR